MLKEFDPRMIDWCSYKFMLDTFFELYDVERIAKIELLRKLGGRHINEALSEKGLVADDDDDCDENRVFEILEETFYDPNEIWKKRSQFSCQEQGEGESGADFLTRLQDLAEGCNFHEDFERVCEQFILGVRSEGLKKRLMVEPPSKLSKAMLLEISSLWESTPRDYDYDFSQLEYAVRKLCKHPLVRKSPKSTQKVGVRESSVTSANAPSETQHSDEAKETETVVPAMLSPETAKSRLRNLRRKVKPRPPAEKLVKKKTKKKALRDSLEQVPQEESQSIPVTVPDVDGTRAAATKCVVRKRRGRPPSTAFIVGGKRYKCNHCDYMSDVRRSILRHERIHTGDRPYQCQFCELRFREKHHLQNHERVHTGETPYICEHCGRGFSKSSTLTDHVRTHTKEAPHLCEFCGRGFIQKSALNTHKLIHTGYRPHSCTLCCRGFTTSNLLKSHMKTHSVDNPSVKGSQPASARMSEPLPASEPYPVSLSVANFPHNADAGGGNEPTSGVWPQGPSETLSCPAKQNDCLLPVAHPQPSTGAQKHLMDSARSTLGLPDW